MSQSLGICALLSATAMAGPQPAGVAATADAFAGVRRPMTNPTLFDLALPTTNIHAIGLFHSLPNKVNTTIGDLAMGGEVNIYALQLEYALNERLSLVATKDGYVDFKPDNTALWSRESGFANLAGGVKYAFIYDPQDRRVVSGTLTYEAPTGNDDVFQGAGDGAVNLIVTGLQMAGNWEFAGGAGVHVPFSDEQSSKSWVSLHASYEVKPWFIPLVELNWFHVLDEGDGTSNFNSQAGGAVPGVAEFEGGDLLNFGAVNAGHNSDLVSAAVGVRARLNDAADVGLAYEVPLTNERDGIMKDRVTLDLVWRF